MATLVHENRKIAGKMAKVYKLYFRVDGQRDRIYLGRKCSVKARHKLLEIVEELEQLRMVGEEPSPALRRKLNGLDSNIHADLVSRGLASPKQNKTLDQVIEACIKSYRNPNTIKEWNSLRSNCREVFGLNKPISEISLEDIDTFVNEYLVDQYAPATIEKRLKNFKQAFRHAADRGWLLDNPAQKAKFRISREQKVAKKDHILPERFNLAVKAMPNAEWRGYLAWMRWLGARAKEPLHDEWRHIDQERRQIHRFDIKKKTRIEVPIPYELQPFIEAMKATHVASGRKQEGLLFPSVAAHKNPWTFVKRQLEKSGLEVWANLFNSLRASRSRELIRMVGPATESALIGHTRDIAFMHYDAVLDEDLALITDAPVSLKPSRSDEVASHPPVKAEEANEIGV